MTTMTKAEYARYRKVERSTVNTWETKGLLVFDPDGRVHVSASDAVLKGRPVRYRGGKTSQTSDAAPGSESVTETTVEAFTDVALNWTISEAVRRKEIALALTRQLEYDRERGALIPAADIEAIMRSDYTATATRLLGVPSKVAPRVAAMKSVHEVEAFLHKEFVKALNSLSKAAGDQLRKIDGAIH